MFPQICPAKRVLAMCHICAILVAYTTEICAGRLINAALRVRAGCGGSSACCACRHPRDTIHEVWALVNDQKERSLNSGVQRKYYPDVVQPKLISNPPCRITS
ncbi:hypothetical protein EDD22DRAFT_284051 [Suillus occidentalis]|nr:hypothetical protein EDD22DRAFT_284051 [Suillus occidentalis]